MDLRGKSLRELEALLTALTDAEERGHVLDALECDPRKGAGALALKARRNDEKARQRDARWRAFCDPERMLRQRGYDRIAGVDEAGRGPLAGPVVAAAVVLPPDFVHHPLDDSKRMTPNARQIAYRAIDEGAEAVGVGVASVEEIDRHNILGAVHLAVDRALNSLDPPAKFALVDGRPLTACVIPHQAIVGGDRRCRAIAAASVIAKVIRDEMMMELDRKYPQYGFSSHKGYATAAHIEALELHGPTIVHRRSFLSGKKQLKLDTEPGPESPQAWGERAEGLVEEDYRGRGYDILHRRWRGGGGEIDLVCARGNEIVVVEIKAARGDLAGSPLEWLGPEQRRRLRSATSSLLKELGSHSEGLVLRFDLVGVLDRTDGPPDITRLEGIEP